MSRNTRADSYQATSKKILSPLQASEANGVVATEATKSKHEKELQQWIDAIVKVTDGYKLDDDVPLKVYLPVQRITWSIERELTEIFCNAKWHLKFNQCERQFNEFVIYVRVYPLE
jgi:hypothetical protein